MREYSLRFLIAMIIGICVLLLFITGRSDQTATEDIFPFDSSELKGSSNIVRLNIYALNKIHKELVVSIINATVDI